MGKVKRYYKCTGPDGIAYHDGVTQYKVGETLTVKDASPASVGPCGRGLHVVTHLCDLRQYINSDILRSAEFFEVAINPADIIAKDSTKTRVRSLQVLRRMTEKDFGILKGKLVNVIGYGSGYGYGYGDGYGE